MPSLHGKWSLVTGASRGVGAHLSTALAQLGSNVVLHSRRLDHTRDLAARLAQTGVKVVTVAGELSDQRAVDDLLDAALEQAGAIDIVYNNAAIMTPYRENTWEVTAEDFRTSFEVNVISLARICYRLMPPMLSRRWGRVVNLTSGIKEQPELCAYSISKAAVDKFVRDFVPKLAGTGVQMNLLDPGWLRTDLGGPRAPNDPATCLPGALVPALLDDGISGRFFCAQDYAGLTIEAALTKAGRR
ncbi:putative oxidoreductase [Lacunisphaera limnophila]|uniref:Putative oxidoreductase n=1 Tax=Lacunisphaera limnophila TaxID=1838286 RepID=A0A1D8AV41_9BACT|nr:SDR family oxidoreductase [Lacunisphaera limnophila]AOS44767.1 putative oxidoreductase [Lacunisphaera limnophila]